MRRDVEIWEDGSLSFEEEPGAGMRRVLPADLAWEIAECIDANRDRLVEPLSDEFRIGGGVYFRLGSEDDPIGGVAVKLIRVVEGVEHLVWAMEERHTGRLIDWLVRHRDAGGFRR